MNKTLIILILALSTALLTFMAAHNIHNAGRSAGMVDLVEGRVVANKHVAKTGIYWKFIRVE